ncbi:alpha/beta fold hydrolase [Yoonia sp. R2331]|uniref:alpha/beta fold hydrolase n=1 Tax=Yoonia sp. R2331 TaxID=3237238 RepID=UPI0034E4E741
MTWTTRQRSDFAGLRAVVAGNGPVLLLLHGVGLRAEAWGAQIDALAGAFRVIAVDLPGHGESGGVVDDLARVAGELAASLDAPALVAGHSMGAMIALEVASRHPGKLCGVAALNAIFERDPVASAAVQARAAALDGVSAVDPALTLQRWFGEADSAERRACEAWLRGVDPAAYRAAYSAFAQGDGPAPAALQGLDCPALFMTGAEEPNSTPAMSRAMAGLAPKGRAVIVPGAAHMMPMTHADAVTRALHALATATGGT